MPFRVCAADVNVTVVSVPSTSLASGTRRAAGAAGHSLVAGQTATASLPPHRSLGPLGDWISDKI